MFELPEEIIEYIISFTCDRRGYNYEKYMKRINDNSVRMQRIIREVKYFKYLNVSVSWLKPSKKQTKNGVLNFKKSLKNGEPNITYHTGCYVSDIDEELLYTYTNKN